MTRHGDLSFPQLPPHSSAPRQAGATKLFVSLVVATIICGGLLVFQATRSTTSLMLDPADLIDQPATSRERIRVAGRVSNAPISYEVEPRFVLRFSLQSRERPEAGSIPVVYESIKPDMFQEGRDVLIDGDYRGGILYARELLTQCPSKYEPPSPDVTHSKGVTSGVALGSTPSASSAAHESPSQ